MGNVMLEQSQGKEKKVDKAMKSKVLMIVVVGGKFGKKDWICSEGPMCFHKDLGSNEWFLSIRVTVKFMFMKYL